MFAPAPADTEVDADLRVLLRRPGASLTRRGATTPPLSTLPPARPTFRAPWSKAWCSRPPPTRSRDGPARGPRDAEVVDRRPLVAHPARPGAGTRGRARRPRRGCAPAP